MILSKLHLDTYEAENNRTCCVDFMAIPYLQPVGRVCVFVAAFVITYTLFEVCSVLLQQYFLLFLSNAHQSFLCYANTMIKMMQPK